jgi:hypothetical protein
MLLLLMMMMNETVDADDSNLHVAMFWRECFCVFNLSVANGKNNGTHGGSTG